MNGGMIVAINLILEMMYYILFLLVKGNGRKVIPEAGWQPKGCTPSCWSLGLLDLWGRWSSDDNPRQVLQCLLLLRAAFLSSLQYVGFRLEYLYSLFVAWNKQNHKLLFWDPSNITVLKLMNGVEILLIVNCFYIYVDTWPGILPLWTLTCKAKLILSVLSLGDKHFLGLGWRRLEAPIR